ncbi:MAG: hypothetical protein KDD47_06505 [Acidobacteria bacterium]|nr:hypothetical protein [Acidobacteriota bacterium]
MELPEEVLIHNATLGLKGGRGVLLRIAPEGYYEVNLAFGDKKHRTLLPVAGTVIICRESEPVEIDAEFEIER